MSLKGFTEKSLLKPWDVFIILFLIVLSFLPVMISGLQRNIAAVEKEAVLHVDGTEIKTFPLMAGGKSYTYTYKDKHGDYNLIEIDGDRVRIEEAGCDNQTCVRRGRTTKNGETIVCLPHRSVIEI